MSTSNEVVVVTGASSGIGEAIAAALAVDGTTVACLSRRGTVPTVEDVAADRLIPIACDVSEEAERVAAIDQVLALGLPVTGLVNAAGFQLQTASAELSLDELHLIMETNLVGSFRMCQLLYEPLRAAERTGLIVNIGSFYGKLGVPNFLAYSASKAAISAMTRTLAVEWARQGIAVLDVAPGYVETGLNADFLEVDQRDRRKIERRCRQRIQDEAVQLDHRTRGATSKKCRSLRLQEDTRTERPNARNPRQQLEHRDETLRQQLFPVPDPRRRERTGRSAHRPRHEDGRRNRIGGRGERIRRGRVGTRRVDHLRLSGRR